MGDQKSTYLFAFERAFAEACGGYRISAAWEQGMWCGAHMYHGQGVPADVGARRLFADLMSMRANAAKLRKLREQAKREGWA